VCTFGDVQPSFGYSFVTSRWLILSHPCEIPTANNYVAYYTNRYNGSIQGVLLLDSSDVVHEESGNLPAGSSVLVAKCDGTADQKWTWNSNGTVQQVSTGRFLDIAGCRRTPDHPAPGPAIVAFTGTDPACKGLNQRFRMNTNGSITNALDGQCLNVFEHSPGHGKRSKLARDR